jgi:hypothetical protein
MTGKVLFAPGRSVARGAAEIVGGRQNALSRSARETAPRHAALARLQRR